MRSTKTFAVAFLCGLLLWRAGGAPAFGSRDDEQAVQAIRARYLAVNRAAKRYTRVERELLQSVQEFLALLRSSARSTKATGGKKAHEAAQQHSLADATRG